MFTEEQRQRLKQLDFSPGGRGFLTFYPLDVVCLINGKAITKGDILDAKREKQHKHLEFIRRPSRQKKVPCYIWTFFNSSWIYHGWWLYVVTAYRSWGIDFRSHFPDEFKLNIMRLFPCGFLPLVSNLKDWEAAFAKTYPRPGKPKEGRVLATAIVDGHELLDVQPRNNVGIVVKKQYLTPAPARG